MTNAGCGSAYACGKCGAKPKKGHVCPAVMGTTALQPGAPPGKQASHKRPLTKDASDDDEESAPLGRRRAPTSREPTTVPAGGTEHQSPSPAPAVPSAAGAAAPQATGAGAGSGAGMAEDFEDLLSRALVAARASLAELERKCENLASEQAAAAGNAHKYQAELQKKDAELKAAQAAACHVGAHPLWRSIALRDIQASVMAKLNAAYAAALAEATQKHEQASAASAAQALTAWSVTLDTGQTFCLPDAANTAVEAAYQAWTVGSVPESTTVRAAYEQMHNGQKFSYDLSFANGVVSQCNTSTHKVRPLHRAQPATPGAPPADIVMNAYHMPLLDDGRYVFAQELQRIKQLGVTFCHTNVSVPVPELLALGTTFSKPFRGFDFTASAPAEARSWCNGMHLMQFLAIGEQMAVGPGALPGAGCFVWAHGTAQPERILRDVCGMNMRHSDPNNYKGPGIYVAQNDFVPGEWSERQRGKARGTPFSAYVIGVALRSDNDGVLAERYRMAAAVPVRGEPAEWAKSNVHHAIILRNAQLLGATCLGSLVA